MGVKLLLTLNAGEVADTESLDVYAEHSRLLRALSWFDFGLVLPLAVFGIWQGRADWRRLSLLYAVLLVLLLSVAAFFVRARYRYPAVFVALLFAACGISVLVLLTRDRLEHAVSGCEGAIRNRPAPATRSRRHPRELRGVPRPPPLARVFCTGDTGDQENFFERLLLSSCPSCKKL
jgi:hypothetical protein